MSAEKIIQRIKNDAEAQAKEVLMQAEKEASSVIEQAKEDAKLKADNILEDGKAKAENEKKILLSQANQELKRKTLEAKEEVIAQCFSKAEDQLKGISVARYKKIVKNLIEQGVSRIDGKAQVLVTRPEDKEVAKSLGIEVAGQTEGLGGIIVKSMDGRMTVDNTFDGILKRKYYEIRVEVGKLLFS